MVRQRSQTSASISVGREGFSKQWATPRRLHAPRACDVGEVVDMETFRITSILSSPLKLLGGEERWHDQGFLFRESSSARRLTASGRRPTGSCIAPALARRQGRAFREKDANSVREQLVLQCLATTACLLER